MLRSTNGMRARRRAFIFLNSFLGALPLLIVGGSMVVYLLVQILAGLRVTSTVTSDYATLSDLLGTLRVDTRSAVSAELPNASEDHAQPSRSGSARRPPRGQPPVGQSPTYMLILRSEDATIRYRFAGPRVVRWLEPAGGSAVEHVWTLKRIVLTVSAPGATGPPKAESTSVSGDSLFHLTARWPGDDRHALRPDRRFDTAYFVGRSYR